MWLFLRASVALVVSLTLTACPTGGGVNDDGGTVIDDTDTDPSLRILSATAGPAETVATGNVYVTIVSAGSMPDAAMTFAVVAPGGTSGDFSVRAVVTEGENDGEWISTARIDLPSTTVMGEYTIASFTMNTADGFLGDEWTEPMNFTVISFFDVDRPKILSAERSTTSLVDGGTINIILRVESLLPIDTIRLMLRNPLLPRQGYSSGWVTSTFNVTDLPVGPGLREVVYPYIVPAVAPSGTYSFNYYEVTNTFFETSYEFVHELGVGVDNKIVHDAPRIFAGATLDEEERANGNFVVHLQVEMDGEFQGVSYNTNSAAGGYYWEQFSPLVTTATNTGGTNYDVRINVTLAPVVDDAVGGQISHFFVYDKNNLRSNYLTEVVVFDPIVD